MRRWALILVIAGLVLSACAVPRERSDLSLRKDAVTTQQVEDIVERYREVRNAAISLLDPNPLSTVETGAVLAIDAGSFEVAQRLSGSQSEVPPITVDQVFAPAFDQYPLWFVAVVRDPNAEVRRVQVFERERSVDPWLLVASPETTLETNLPEIRMSTADRAVAVEPGNGVGLSASPQDAATDYAATLNDPDSEAAGRIEADDFIRQMRDAASQNAALGNVQFSQEWSTEDVRFALRTAGGGALVFVTLVRDDTYVVADGLTVSWPEGSPQQAFLEDGITGSGTLRYAHQVLLHLPGGDAKPRAIGQYGGVVGTVD